MGAEDHRRGISRRRLLKRLGAGTAVAWSAPILSSIRAPAFANYLLCPIGTVCDFSKIQFCGEPNAACANPPTCFAVANCAVMLDGSCICWDVAACFTEGNQPICQSDADCAQIAPTFPKCGQFDRECLPPGPCIGGTACYHICGSLGQALPADDRVSVHRASG